MRGRRVTIPEPRGRKSLHAYIHAKHILGEEQQPRGQTFWSRQLHTSQAGTRADMTYFPTKFSRTELLPALWPPTTAICAETSQRRGHMSETKKQLAAMLERTSPHQCSRCGGCTTLVGGAAKMHLFVLLQCVLAAGQTGVKGAS